MIYKLKYPVTIRKWIKTLTGYRTAELCAIEWREISGLFPQDGRLKEFDGQIVQRNLSMSRVRKLADYMLGRILEEKRFTIPPIILTILPADWDADNEAFEDRPKIPFNHAYDGKPEVLPPGTIVVINDGQHRVEAIRLLVRRFNDKKWLKEQNFTKEQMANINKADARTSELSAQVHTVFFAEEMQQMFADINANASKPSKSLTLFFDKANDFNSSIAKLIEKSNVLRGRTDVQKNVCSGRSSNVFTVATVTAAVRSFYADKKPKDALSDEEIDLLVRVFDKLAWIWQTDDRTAEKLRNESLAPHSVFMQGLMDFMSSFVVVHHDWESRPVCVPWQRQDNPVMLNRCVASDGRILAGARNAKLVNAALRREHRLQLSPADLQAERELESELSTIADMEAARKKNEHKA